MKYGTIGTSMITDNFIRSSRLVDGLDLTAVYSRRLEKGLEFSQKYGVKTVFTDMEQMASSDAIDAVYVASPNSLHYEQCKLFLQHGKHVLCEKPIAVTSVQVRELIDLARQKNVVYMEAIIMLHLPARLLLREALQKIGTITTARFDYSQLSSKYQSYLNGDVPNIFNPKFATGCLMDLGIYCVYPALDFFGMPEKITTAAGFLATGADGCGSSIFSYQDKQVTLSYSKTGQSRVGSEILGDKGTIVIDSISKLTGIKIVWNDGTEEPLVGDVPKDSIMSGEARSFFHYVTDRARYEEEYQYACELAVQVSETMGIMREQANIKFC